MGEMDGRRRRADTTKGGGPATASSATRFCAPTETGYTPPCQSAKRQKRCPRKRRWRDPRSFPPAVGHIYSGDPAAWRTSHLLAFREAPAPRAGCEAPWARLVRTKSVPKH
ncbi:hypothetical protein Purlil1_11716 [Purpureocillium lilacinum]|uniref:Uncharacterized protein n=1 Tax=Purpureocillium lilacinum TaxID=33203 RepID=A0ABR0BJ97_PURLI|nr:hypothetical protein Purlil1_11716 [Purpureocillium lilacinum]